MSFFSSISDTFNSAKEWVSEAIDDTVEYGSDIIKQIGSQIKGVTADDKAINYTKETESAQRLQQKHGINLGDAEDKWYQPFDWMRGEDGLDNKMMQAANNPLIQQAVRDTSSIFQQAQDPNNPTTQEDFLKKLNESNKLVAQTLKSYNIPVNEGTWSYEDTQDFLNTAGTLTTKNRNYTGIDPATGKIKGLSTRQNKEDDAAALSADSSRKEMTEYLRGQYAKNIEEDKFTILDSVVNRNTYFQIESNLTSYYADKVSSFDTMINQLEDKRSKVDPDNIESFNNKIEQIVQYRDKFKEGFKESAPFILANKDIEKANEEYRKKYNRDISDSMSLEYGEHSPIASKIFNAVDPTNLVENTADFLTGGESSLGKTKMTLFDAAAQLKNEAVTQINAKSFADYVEKGISWVSRGTSFFTNYIGAKQEQVGDFIGQSDELSKLNMTSLKNELESGELSDESSRLTRIGRSALDFSPYILDLVADPLNYVTFGGGAVAKVLTKADDATRLVKAINSLDKIDNTVDLLKFVDNTPELKLFQKSIDTLDNVDEMKAIIRQESLAANKLTQAYTKSTVIESVDGTKSIPLGKFSQQKDEAIELLKQGGGLTTNGRQFIINTLMEDKSTLAKAVGGKLLDLAYETVYMDAKMQNWMSAQYTPLDAAFSFGTEIGLLGIKALKNMNVLSSNYLGDLKKYVGNVEFQKQFMTQLFKDDTTQLKSVLESRQALAQTTKSLISSVPTSKEGAELVAKKSSARKILSEKQSKDIKKAVEKTDVFGTDFFDMNLSAYKPKPGEKNIGEGFFEVVPVQNNSSASLLYNVERQTFTDSDGKALKSYLIKGDAKVTPAGIEIDGKIATAQGVPSGKFEQGEYIFYKTFDGKGYILERRTIDGGDALDPTYKSELYYIGNQVSDNVPLDIVNSKNLGNISFVIADAKKIKGAVKLFSDTAIPTVDEWKAKFFDFIQKNYISELQNFGATEMDLLYDSVYKTLQNSYYGSEIGLTFDTLKAGNHHGVITASFIVDLIQDPQLAESFKNLASTVGYDSSIVKNFLAANIYQDPTLGILFEKQIRTVMENGSLINPKYRIESDDADFYSINTTVALEDIKTNIINSPNQPQSIKDELAKFESIDQLRLSWNNRKGDMNPVLSAEITRQYNLIANQMYAQQDYNAFGKLIDYNLQASYLTNSSMLLKSMGYESSITDMAASFFQYIGIRNLTNQLNFDPEFAKKSIVDKTAEASSEFQKILSKIRKDFPDSAETVSAYQTASIVAKTMHEYKGQIKAVKEYVDSLSDPSKFSLDKFLEVYQIFLKKNYEHVNPIGNTDLDILDDFKNLFASIEKQFNQSLTETSSIKLKRRIVKDIQETNIKDFLDSMENYLVKEGLSSTDNLFRLQGTTIGSMFVVNFGNVLYKNSKNNIRVGDILAEEGLHLLQSHLNLLDYNFKVPGLNKIEQKLEYLADDKWPLFKESISQAIQNADSDLQKALVLNRSYKEIEADYVRAFIGPDYQKDWAINKFTEATRFIEDQYIALEIKSSDKQIRNMKSIFMNKLSGLETRNKILQSIPDIKREHILKSFEGVRVDSPLLGSIDDQYKLDKAYVGLVDELSLNMQSATGGDIVFRGEKISFKPFSGGTQAEQLTYYTKLARKVLRKNKSIISKLDPQEAYHVLGDILRDSNLIDKYVDYQVIKDFKSFIAAGSNLVSVNKFEELQTYIKTNLGKELDVATRSEVDNYLFEQLSEGKLQMDEFEKYQSQIDIWVAGNYADNVVSEDLADQVVPYIKAIQERFVSESSQSSKDFLKYNMFDFLLNSYYKSTNGTSTGLYSVSQFIEKTKKFVVLKYVDKGSVENKTAAGFISWANKQGNRIILPDTTAEVIDIAGKSRKEVYDIIQGLPEGTAVFSPSGKIGRNFFTQKDIKIISGDEFPTVHFDVDSSNNLSFTFTNQGVFDNWIEEMGVPPALYVKDLYAPEKELVVKKWKDSFYESMQRIGADAEEQRKIIDDFEEEQIVSAEYMLSNTLQQGTPYAVGPGSQFFGRFADSFINQKERSLGKVKEWYNNIMTILTGEVEQKSDSFYDELFRSQSQFKKDILSITSSQFNEVKLFQAQNNFLQKYSKSTIDKNIVIGGERSLNILDKNVPIQSLMQTVFLSDKFRSVKLFNPNTILNLLNDIDDLGYVGKSFTKEESRILAELYVSNKPFFSRTGYERLDDLIEKEISSDDIVDTLADELITIQASRQKSLSEGQSLLGDEENKIFYDEVIEYLQTVRSRAEDLLYGDGNNVINLGSFDSRILNYINGKGGVEAKIVKDDFIQKAFKGFTDFDFGKYKQYVRTHYKRYEQKTIDGVSDLLNNLKTNNDSNAIILKDDLLSQYYPIWEKINRININSFGTSVKPLNIQSMNGGDFDIMVGNWINDFKLEYTEKIRSKIGFITGDNSAQAMIGSLIQGRGYIEIPKITEIDGTKLLGFVRYTVKDFTADLLQNIKKESIEKSLSESQLGSLNITTKEIDDIIGDIKNPKLSIYDASNIAKQVLSQYYLHKYTTNKFTETTKIFSEGLEKISQQAEPTLWDTKKLIDYIDKNGLLDKSIPEKFKLVGQNLVYAYSYNGGGLDVTKKIMADGIFKDLFVGTLYDTMLKNYSPDTSSREIAQKVLDKLSPVVGVNKSEKIQFQIGGIKDGSYIVKDRSTFGEVLRFNVDDKVFDQVDKIFKDSILERSKQLVYEKGSSKNPSVLGSLDQYVMEIIGGDVYKKFADLKESNEYKPFTYFNAKKDGKNSGDDSLFKEFGVTQDYILKNIKVKIGESEGGIGMVNNGYGVYTIIKTQAYNKILDLFINRLNQEFAIKMDEGQKLLESDPEGFGGFVSSLGAKTITEAIEKRSSYKSIDQGFFKKAIDNYEKRSGQKKFPAGEIESQLTNATRTNLLILPQGGSLKPGDKIQYTDLNGKKSFEVDIVWSNDSIINSKQYQELTDIQKQIFGFYQKKVDGFGNSSGFTAALKPIDSVDSKRIDIAQVFKELNGIKQLISERRLLNQDVEDLNSEYELLLDKLRISGGDVDPKKFERDERSVNQQLNLYNQITKDSLYQDVKDYIILKSKSIADEFLKEVNDGYVKSKTLYENGALDSGGLEVGSRVIEEKIPLGKEVRGLEGNKYGMPEFKIDNGVIKEKDPAERAVLGKNTLSSLNCNI